MAASSGKQPGKDTVIKALAESVTKKEPRVFQLTGRHLISVVGGVLGILVALGTIHTTWVMPAILSSCRRESRTDMEKMLDAHTKGTHPNGVTQREFEMLSSQLNRVGDSLEKRLERIESKL